MTKKKKRLYDIAYRKRNKSEIAKKRKAYQERTKLQKKKYDHKYYQLKIEEKRAYGREYARIHHKHRRKYFKKWCMMNKYGITIEQVSEMKFTQKSRCALCGDKFRGEIDVCVDHNHSTGQVRELLCKRCNLGIGQLREDPQLLLKAHDYLIRWSKP